MIEFSDQIVEPRLRFKTNTTIGAICQLHKQRRYVCQLNENISIFNENFNKAGLNKESGLLTIGQAVL